MLELLSPAGGSEAVIAAVQSGTDMVYMGYGLSDPGNGNEAGFASRGLSECLRYCRIRDCRTAVAINRLISDRGMDAAIERAVFAAQQGAQALVIQDLGLAAALHACLPDVPLWGGVRMGIRNPEAAAAAAAMGLSRIMLPPELTLAEIRSIADAVPAEIAVCVHGPLCFAHVGRCYLSAAQNPETSDSCLHCAEPCKGRFSLGGRMDEYPMAMADIYLMHHLDELAEAGVTAVYIEGRGRSPEYIAYVTRLYARAIHDRALPNEEEEQQLRTLFATNGLTDGYFTGQQGADMFGTVRRPDRAALRAVAAIRKSVMEGETRRVPVRFYAVMQRGKKALFAAEDDHGHRASCTGFVPSDLGRQGITDERVRTAFYRTGGTPYICREVRCAIDSNLDYPEDNLDLARKTLLSQITEQNRDPAPVRVLPVPTLPESTHEYEKPDMIIQVSRREQLTPELAAAEPEHLYVPAEILAADIGALEPFREKHTLISAVLPPLCAGDEMSVIRELLAVLRDNGVRSVLVGDLGYILPVRQAGLRCRGDYGLNITNSRAADFLARAGFVSLTASFQLSTVQLRHLAKPVDTEAIIYGRLPVMTSEHCLIRNSAGRCACSTPTNMNDEHGRVFPVEKEFGCRSIVYDDKKIFLADMPEYFTRAGLWAGRLFFTTESPHECAAIAMRYRGSGSYTPNNISRGMFPKGVQV